VGARLCACEARRGEGRGSEARRGEAGRGGAEAGQRRGKAGRAAFGSAKRALARPRVAVGTLGSPGPGSGDPEACVSAGPGAGAASPGADVASPGAGVVSPGADGGAARSAAASLPAVSCTTRDEHVEAADDSVRKVVVVRVL
jgi:hypothetical protein